LHILNPRSEHWHPPVETYSALNGTGIDHSGKKFSITAPRCKPLANSPRGGASKQVKWMWSMLEQRILARLRSEPSIRAKVKKIEAEVAEGHVTPALAAEQIAGMLK